MSIQLSQKYPQVRIGNKFFPAKIAEWSGGGYCKPFAYQIPLGNSNESISVAIGYGSYSDNYDKKIYDPFAPMDSVEIAVLRNGEIVGDVCPNVSEVMLLTIIRRHMPLSVPNP